MINPIDRFCEGLRMGACIGEGTGYFSPSFPPSSLCKVDETLRLLWRHSQPASNAVSREPFQTPKRINSPFPLWRHRVVLGRSEIQRCSLTVGGILQCHGTVSPTATLHRSLEDLQGQRDKDSNNCNIEATFSFVSRNVCWGSCASSGLCCSISHSHSCRK